MELFSGRLDVISDKATVKKDLANFFKCYGSNEHDFIVCYEEKTKAGLPCKPHVHFLFYSDKSHDRMRKTLSGYGYIGTLGSLSKVSQNKKYTKETTYSYVMKQKDVILTNLEDKELDQLKEQAHQINQQIRDKMTTFHQHWQQCIVPRLILEDITERVDIIIFVHKYVTSWNLENEEEPPINYPCRQTLLNLMQIFEGKYLPENEARRRFVEDMGYSYETSFVLNKSIKK